MGPENQRTIIAYMDQEEFMKATKYSRRDFLNMVETLRTPYTSLILITHQLEVARALSDRVFIFERGRIREEL